MVTQDEGWTQPISFNCHCASVYVNLDLEPRMVDLACLDI